MQCGARHVRFKGEIAMDIRIETPLDVEAAKLLHAGDSVLISGVIYTARDAAHQLLAEMIRRGEKLPLPLRGQIIYYAGPTPNRPGLPVGSLGPTTSGRMDKYTPLLIQAGLTGMIGKGKRSRAVKQSMMRNGAVYFGAVGGAGALLAKSVLSRKVVAFPELQSEAVSELCVRDFPCFVLMDAYGGDLYKTGPTEYRLSR